MCWETNVTSTTYVFKYCHNLHFTTQFVKNKQNHINKAVTAKCTQEQKQGAVVPLSV